MNIPTYLAETFDRSNWSSIFLTLFWMLAFAALVWLIIWLLFCWERKDDSAGDDGKADADAAAKAQAEAEADAKAQADATAAAEAKIRDGEAAAAKAEAEANADAKVRADAEAAAAAKAEAELSGDEDGDLDIDTASEEQARDLFASELAAGSVKQDSVYGIIYDGTPDGGSDDLKKIKGVAQVLEGKLNDIGVYRFKQVAVWTDTACEEFSKMLTFKDRIYRDNWIAQAKTFHEEKYGEKL